ncbi:TetR family transcriptional regulator [Photobacterium phosphoreum]|uniref:TetR family transcriptional regulator n=1 Tax=Photobacterium phosphoreum TaxID=659 RepID=UPI000D181089|nr:TetR family transcriptional regulator [Photobacterium phosphoreum]PSU85515.1 TetR family transcriptional regulator [Photobacterium phosphoreum]
MDKETPTKKMIRLAIIAIEKRRPKVVTINRKMSVAAVAEEAGVSRALIHRDFPDLLERIRGGANKAIAKQRNDIREQLKREKEHHKECCLKIKELSDMLANMQSINATLTQENKELRLKIDSDKKIQPIR